MRSAASSSYFWPSHISSRVIRRIRGALAAALAVVALAGAFSGAARAQTPPSRGLTRADSAAQASQPKTEPWKVMARSAVVPGWGQLYNHQPLKAALVVGTEGTLVALALRELKLQNDAAQRAADAAAFGDTAAESLAILETETHRNRKISWIWWAVAAHLLSMADAYVDAHLSTFDSDFGRQEALLPRRHRDRPDIALAYRVRF